MDVKMDAIKQSLDRYVKDGIRPGSFVNAVLSNDLMGAIGYADDMNRLRLPEICIVVTEDVPWRLYGSASAVDTWVTIKQRESETSQEESNKVGKQ